ncbi:MAG: hypothetical protein H7Z73_07700 [Candidatus Saccharibacteria bacterium]|nr:hypothetical protein [Moraxellaceae bacterium]
MPEVLKQSNDYVMISNGMYGAYLDGIAPYKNSNNEIRYLVGIIIVGLDEDSIPNEQAIQQAILDLYIFKKNSEGKYELVSRTKELSEPTGKNGSPDGSEINKQIKLLKSLGKDLVGTIGSFQTRMLQGYYDEYWQIVRLSEDNYITFDNILKAQISGAEKDSPTYYNTTSNIKVTNDGSKNYPILVHYKGEEPIYKNDADGFSHLSDVRDVDSVVIWQYSEPKSQYQIDK